MSTGRETELAELADPVEIGERVWWVGAVSPSGEFQGHSYLIEAGDQSVLVDPGSVLTTPAVLAKVRRVLDPSMIRWVVCHRAGPDACGGLAQLDDVVHPDARVVTEWRAARMLRHYQSRLPLYLIEDHGWTLELGENRRCEFTLTPYLHFPGALAAYETGAAVLFSGDLFGGFADAASLWARDESYFESVRGFHEHFMPSGEILRAGLDKLRHRWPQPRVIAPQLGRVIPEPLVGVMFERLANLECGIFLLAEDDVHLRRLLQAAELERNLARTLLSTSELSELADRASAILREYLPVERVEAYVTTESEGLLRFAADEGYAGTPVAAFPDGVNAPYLDLARTEDAPPIRVYLVLPAHTALPHQFARVLIQLSRPIQIALVEHLDRRSATREHERILAETMSDPLTGLSNRRALTDPHLANDPSAILMIDVDRFKAINDEFGHDVGDAALGQVATVIRANVRSRSDLAVRYGGDEFLVVLREADEAHALDVAERIRRQVERVPATTLFARTAVDFTVSIGVTLHHGHLDLGLSIARADRALYRAKHDGRNRVAATWPSAHPVRAGERDAAAP